MKPHPEALHVRRLQTELHLNSARILRRMERRVTLLFREVGIDDLTPAQSNVLVVLFHHKRPLHARELAANLGVSEVTVARFVRALETAGWIGRERHPSDARALLIKLTQKAYEALPTLIRVSNTMMDEAFQGFDLDAITAFAGLTNRVLGNLGESGEQKKAAPENRSKG